MNKTKKLTQGAMMIAIVGALILIDRLFTNLFDMFIILLSSVVIIMYSTMYTVKDGFYVSLGVLFVTFIFGSNDMYYVALIPVAVVTALAYSYAVSRNVDRRTVMFISMISFIFGEIIASFIVFPIFGFPIVKQIAEIKSFFDTIHYSEAISAIGLNIDKILIILFILGTILTGAMEGLLIHLLAIFLLKRFKIKNLGVINIWELKPNKILAYVCFVSMFGLFLYRFIENDNLKYVTIIIAILDMMVLLYYGYIFLVIYGRVVLRRNIASFVVLICFLFPPIIISMTIIGFLYGAGPLRDYLEVRISEGQQ